MDMKMKTLSDLNILDVGNTIQMAGAVYVDDGQMYLAMFPEERGDARGPLGGEDPTCFYAADGAFYKIDVLDMDQDDWAKFIRQTDIVETEILARSSDGTLAKTIVRKTQRQIEQGVMWKVYKRDGYKCRYCGNDDTPLTVDHLVCWNVGGPSTVENLVAACRKCNKTRGDTTYEGWLQHPHYLRVSKSLTEAERKANVALAETLANIPLQIHKKSR